MTSGINVPNMRQIASRSVWTLWRGYNRIRNVNAAVTAGLKTSEIIEAYLWVVIRFSDAIEAPLLERPRYG